MKPQNSDDLIITNEEPQQADTSGVKEKKTPEPKPEKAEEEPSKTFSEILSANASEEDAPLPSGVTLIKILGGEFFTAKVLKRQIWVIILIAVMTVVYISNRYSCQKSQIEVDKLNKELVDAKYRALATSSELTEISRESNVLEVLKAIGDSDIKVSSEPPYYINIPEQEKK